MRLSIKKIGKLRIATLSFYIFLLLKPLYILPSGSLQIGDAFLAISSLFLFLENKNHLDYLFKKEDKTFYIFIAITALINMTYFIIYAFAYNQTNFYKSILFYVFNMMAVVCFRSYIENYRFRKNVRLICIINIVFQFALYIFGIGNWYGNIRYIGTYNDPNQFAFAVLTTFCFIYCLGQKYILFYSALALFLIYKSGSTGMLLAMMILIICALMLCKKSTKITPVKFAGIMISCFIVFTLFLYQKLSFQIDISSLRLEEKLSGGESLISTFVRDRNLDLVFDNLMYCIFGSGEGLFTRFNNNFLEVHSTWFGLLFYYGIISFVFLTRWVYSNIKNVGKQYFPVYIALILEAFTLANQRQPMFWMIFVLGGWLSALKMEDKDID